MFGHIQDVVLDGDGNVGVLDQHSLLIYLFDSTGHHLETFGGRGDGPGELRNATAMELLPDGRIIVVGIPRMGKVFVQSEDGYHIEKTLEVMVDAPEAACAPDADHVFIAGGTGDQRSAVHRVAIADGKLLNHVGTGYDFDDWAVRGVLATGAVACRNAPATAPAVFYASVYLPFVRAYRSNDDDPFWTSRIDPFTQTTMLTRPGGGILVYNDRPRDEIVSLHTISPHHILIQVGHFESLDKVPTTVRTYLVDAQTGFGSMISEDLGVVMAGTAGHYVVVWSTPFPRLEVRKHWVAAR